VSGPDELLGDLRGADGPRAMPAGLRSRLEEALLAGASLPEEARDRLAERLKDPTAAVLAGVDGPRPMPASLRSGVEWSLRRTHVVDRTPRDRSWLAAAACLLLVAASVVVLNTRQPRQPHEESAAGVLGRPVFVETRPEPLAVGDQAGTGAGTGAQASAATAPLAGVVPPDAAVSGNAGGGGGGGAFPTSYDPPPFALTSQTVVRPDLTKRTGPPPPVRITAFSGDPAEQAGFDLYVDLLNRRGGAGGRQFTKVPSSSTADVTVNLTATPFASRPTRPAFDTLLTPEASLRGTVFNFAGAPEHQAHLIADAVFPESTSARAVVYREPSGPLADVVPQAIQAVLDDRNVTAVVVTLEDGRPVVPVPADAVFLSVTGEHAVIVTEAYKGGPQPALGFNGIGTIADRNVLWRLPSDIRYISPYSLPDTDEADYVIGHTNQALSARLIHGWVAAKTLAVAVWLEDPRTPAAFKTALEHMEGYANGFAPAFTFRPGTHSVKPDGVLFVGHDQQGSFLTDAFPGP
jgi:hypothetical protein